MSADDRADDAATHRPSYSTTGDRRFWRLRVLEEARRLAEQTGRQSVDYWVARLMVGGTAEEGVERSADLEEVVHGLADSAHPRGYILRSTLWGLSKLEHEQESSWDYALALAQLDDELLTAVHYAVFRGVPASSRSRAVVQLLDWSLAKDGFRVVQDSKVDWDAWFLAWVVPWTEAPSADRVLIEEAASLEQAWLKAKKKKKRKKKNEPMLDVFSFHVGLCLGVRTFFEHAPLSREAIDALNLLGVAELRPELASAFLEKLGLDA